MHGDIAGVLPCIGKCSEDSGYLDGCVDVFSSAEAAQTVSSYMGPLSPAVERSSLRSGRPHNPWGVC